MTNYHYDKVLVYPLILTPKFVFVCGIIGYIIFLGNDFFLIYHLSFFI